MIGERMVTELVTDRPLAWLQVFSLVMRGTARQIAKPATASPQDATAAIQR
jgi:hypothetical protein